MATHGPIHRDFIVHTLSHSLWQEEGDTTNEALKFLSSYNHIICTHTLRVKVSHVATHFTRVGKCIPTQDSRERPRNTWWPAPWHTTSGKLLGIPVFCSLLPQPKASLDHQENLLVYRDNPSVAAFSNESAAHLWKTKITWKNDPWEKKDNSNNRSPKSLLTILRKIWGVILSIKEVQSALRRNNQETKRSQELKVWLSM